MSKNIIIKISGIYKRDSNIICYSTNRVCLVGILMNIHMVFSYIIRLQFTLYKLFYNFKSYVKRNSKKI